jgi:5'(3')-deoxyribonucleotidase
MIIGIDIDGVLAKYNEALATVVENARGLKPGSLKAPTGWNFPDWDLNRESFRTYHSVLMTNIVDMELYPNASEVVNYLAKDNTIKIITSRGSARLHDADMRPKVYCGTVEWLQKHNIPYNDLCFVENKNEVEADIYIEDSPAHLESFISHNKRYVIFSHKYNDHIPTDLIRTSNWLTILDKVCHLKVNSWPKK